MFLNFDNLDVRYRPFPIGVARPVMTDDPYRRCVDAFPPLDMTRAQDVEDGVGEFVALDLGLHYLPPGRRLLARAINATLDHPPNSEALRTRAQTFTVERALKSYAELIFA